MLLTINKMFYPEIGGVEVVAKQISEFGQDYFGRSEVITFNTEKKNVQNQIGQILVHRIGTNIKKDPIRISMAYAKKLDELSKEAKIILYHFPSFQPEIDVMFHKRNNNSIKICLYHADIVGRGKLGYLYNKIVVMNFLRNMDKIIVTSPNILDSSKILKAFKDKCEVIPLGIDIKHFDYKKINHRKDVLEEFKNLHKDPKIILYVGRLGRYKGLSYLIEALSKLPDNYYLIFVGKGPKEQELRKLAIDIGVDSRIRIFKDVSYDQLPNYYSMADVFTMPSIDRGEAFGLVAIEAMACGIPIITTELGTGTSYHNIDGKTGRVIRPMNVNELKNSIIEICNNKECYKKNVIRKRAEFFSLDKYEDRWLELFKKISN